MKTLHPLADELAQARHDRGLSLAVVAGFAGYSKSAVSAWERGYRMPSVPALEAWAAALGRRLTTVPATDTQRKA